MVVSPREKAVPAQQSTWGAFGLKLETHYYCSERLGGLFPGNSLHRSQDTGHHSEGQDGGAVLAELRRAGQCRADCTRAAS